jgi:CRP/FNR family transcriptional regulator, cyclic AMP receptor protein
MEGRDIMAEAGVLDILREVRFLEGLSEEELRQIASVARLQSFGSGTVIFREGITLSSVFLIIEGSVALEIQVPGQGNKRMQTIGAGELLGWSPLLGRQLTMGSVRALTPAKVVVLDASQIMAICVHDTRFGFMFMQRVAAALAARLSATRLHLLDIYRHELPSVASAQEEGKQS